VKLRQINCRNVRNLLPLHAGGDLDPKQAGAVDEHLHACLPCFREYRELITMRGRLGVLAEQPLPEGALDGFTEEVMARVAVGEPGPRAEMPSSIAWRRRIPRLAAAAALVLMVGVGAHQVGLIGGSESPTNPPRTERLASPTTLADGSARVSTIPPAAESPLRTVDPNRLGGFTRFNQPSNPVGSALFDFVTAGQPIPGEVDPGEPAYGQGLVPEPGRELRLRDPRDQR
jgi:anti-sigma factor RsiW